MHEVTRILSAIEQGDGHAAAQLLPVVYDELRRLAAEKMAQEKPGQTLQATGLVHEAYIRLVDVEQAQHWEAVSPLRTCRCRRRRFARKRSELIPRVQRHQFIIPWRGRGGLRVFHGWLTTTGRQAEHNRAQKYGK
jgi:hypothetical protein